MEGAGGWRGLDGRTACVCRFWDSKAVAVAVAAVVCVMVEVHCGGCDRAAGTEG